LRPCGARSASRSSPSRCWSLCSRSPVSAAARALAMADPVIAARALTKRYGDNLAVDHVDLEVAAGEIVGILGPNGSGKTTTILMLLGLTEPTSGRAMVAGFDPLRDPLEVKRRVGYLPDQIGFYENMSARDNLTYTARLAGLSRREVDDRFDAALE